MSRKSDPKPRGKDKPAERRTGTAEQRNKDDCGAPRDEGARETDGLTSSGGGDASSVDWAGGQQRSQLDLCAQFYDSFWRYFKMVSLSLQLRRYFGGLKHTPLTNSVVVSPLH